MATIAEQKAFDAETKAMLYDGASVSQLGRLFGIDNRMVAQKLASVTPTGERAGHPIYSIKDAAPHLVKPAGDFEAAIKRMNHRELPPMLLKEFWTSLRARREYEHFAGDLWLTDEVRAVATEAFKQMRLALLMLGDRVERSTEITDRQREIIQQEIDRSIGDARARLVTSLVRPGSAAARGGPSSPGGDEPENGGL